MKSGDVKLELSEKCSFLFSRQDELYECGPLNRAQPQNTYFGLLYLAPVRLFCTTLLASASIFMVKVCGNVMQMTRMAG